MNTARGFTPTPPEKGSFPLDHHGECKSAMKEFMSCLKASKNEHHKCQELSKKYLECRMEKGLMQEEDLSTLGFQHKVQFTEADSSRASQSKERTGYLGGLTVKPVDNPAEIMEAKAKEHHNMRRSFDESFPAIRRARESLLRRLHTSDPPPECQSKTDENSEHQERQGLTSWEDDPVPTMKNVVQLEQWVTEKGTSVSTIASHAVATNALRNAGDQDSISSATECQTECQIEHDAYEQEYATYTSSLTEYVSLRAPPAQLVWKEVEEYGARILQPNSLSQTAQEAFLVDKHSTQG